MYFISYSHWRFQIRNTPSLQIFYLLSPDTKILCLLLLSIGVYTFLIRLIFKRVHLSDLITTAIAQYLEKDINFVNYVIFYSLTQADCNIH